jgi:hypothetical protein
VRSCTGTNHDPERCFPHSGTFDASYFHDDQLHDVVQFPGGELPGGLLRSPTADQCAGAGHRLQPGAGDRDADLEYVGKYDVPYDVHVNSTVVPGSMRAELALSLSSLSPRSTLHRPRLPWSV